MEANGEVYGKTSKGAASPIMKEVHMLNVTEGLFIKKEDWPLKTTPVLYVSQVYRTKISDRKYTIRTLLDGSGWVVFRLK